MSRSRGEGGQGLAQPRSSSEAPAALVALQSRLTEPNRGLRYQLLRPLVVLRDAVEYLFRGLVSMVVAEIRGRSGEFSQGQHMAGFVLASLFGIAIYYFSYLDGIVIAVFFALWAMERLAHVSLGAWRQDRVTTRITDSALRWRRLRGGTAEAAEDLPRRSICGIAIGPELLVADAFGRLGRCVWRVELIAEDGALALPIFESQGISAALGPGLKAARTLGVEARLTASTGRGALAEDRPTRTDAHFGAWQVDGSTSRLRVSRPPSAWRALRTTVERNGILVFVVIMTDVFARFGHLVLTLVGPRLGLHDIEPVSMRLSLDGLLAMVTPDLDWLGWSELAIAVLVLAIGFVRALRSEVLEVSDAGVSFTRAGSGDRQFASKGGVEVLKLHYPRPALAFADAAGAGLCLDDLGDEAVEELFAHTDAWLRKRGHGRPVTGAGGAGPGNSGSRRF